MHLRTASILAVALAVLGGLLWLRSRDAADGGVRELYEPLFPELETSRIGGFRIENLRQGTVVAIEHAGGGLWYLTDPIAYPADPSVVQQLLSVVTRNRSLPTRREPADASLDPPRAVLEVVEETPDGERRHRLELGAEDLGGQDVHVRVDGEVRLTSGNLVGPLVHAVDHYREKRIVPLSARDVLALRRRGSFPPELVDLGAGEDPGEDPGEPGSATGPGRDLELAARLTPDGWRLDRPYDSRLDPAGTRFFLQAVTGLRAAAFVDDARDDLSVHGLAPPDAELELEDAGGRSLRLLLGHPGAPGDPWRCMRDGYPHVFELHPDSVHGLVVPVGELLDYRIVRAERDRVARVELATEDRSLTVERADGGWRARSGEGGSARSDAAADEQRVADLLGRLETSEILEYLPGRSFRAAQADGEDGEAVRSFKVVTRAGVEWGGEIGASADTPAGPGRLFRRFGDDVVALVPEELWTLPALPEEELWSPVVHDLDVLVQARVEISGVVGDEERELVYRRDPNSGLWYVGETSVEAPAEFAAYWLDPLLHLRSLRWIDPEAELADPVHVELVDRTGHPATGVHRFTLGVSPLPPSDPRAALPDRPGRVECASPAGRCEARADVYLALRELLR